MATTLAVGDFVLYRGTQTRYDGWSMQITRIEPATGRLTLSGGAFGLRGVHPGHVELEPVPPIEGDVPAFCE